MGQVMQRLKLNKTYLWTIVHDDMSRKLTIMQVVVSNDLVFLFSTSPVTSAGLVSVTLSLCSGRALI